MFYSQGKACSSLFTAAERGYTEIASLLIAAGAEVNVKGNLGETPLHKASMRGHKEIVKLLINHGAQVKASSEDGTTPLYLAALGQHKEIVQLLLDHNATVDFEIAILLGDEEIVKHYFITEGLDANYRLTKGPTKGDTILNIAVNLKNQDLVKLFLNKGALINDKTGTYELSPLHNAASGVYSRHNKTFAVSPDICELLIAHGADLNSQDRYGNTPLHSAVRCRHLEIAELLLKFGADVNALNQQGSSALFEAARTHNAEMAELLLSHGAEVNLRDNEDYTPLLRAFQQSGGNEIVSVLLNYGADVNIRGLNQSSPLHRAVELNNLNAVELLLTYGAREGLE